MSVGGAAFGVYTLPTVRGSSSVRLTMGGSAQGLRGVSGRSSVRLSMLGTASGAHGVAGGSSSALTIGGVAYGPLKTDPKYLPTVSKGTLVFAVRRAAPVVDAPARAYSVDASRAYTHTIQARTYEVSL